MNALIKRNRDLVKNLFEDVFSNGFFPNTTSYLMSEMVGPAVNVSESDKEYLLEVSAPGYTKDSFDVKLKENVITISSKNETKNESKVGSYSRKEFTSSSFSRSFTLPENVITDKISAKYENGILNVSLPKKEVSKKKESGDDSKSIKIN